MKSLDYYYKIPHPMLLKMGFDSIEIL